MHAAWRPAQGLRRPRRSVPDATLPATGRANAPARAAQTAVPANGFRRRSATSTCESGDIPLNAEPFLSLRALQIRQRAEYFLAVSRGLYATINLPDHAFRINDKRVSGRIMFAL